MGELPGVGVSAAHDAAAATSLHSHTSNIFMVHTRYFPRTIGVERNLEESFLGAAAAMAARPRTRRTLMLSALANTEI